MSLLLLAVMEVLVSGGGSPASCQTYFPRVAKEMEIPVAVTVAADWRAELGRRPWRVVVVNPEEATAENLQLIKREATNAVAHVESREVKGWINIPFDKVRAACPLKDLSADELNYLQGCTYLAMLTPADMIQLIWWPETITCDRAEKLRMTAEKVAWAESGKRAEDAPQAEKARCVPWEELNAAPPPLKLIGHLPTRDSTAISSSRWSLGCETMDRHFAVFKNYKSYLSGTAAKHARIQSGWETTEKVRGVYDFKWFDEHVNGLVESGIKPWVCLCYGNPIYNSSPRMRWAVARITEDKEGFPAWKRYVEATVLRYRDRVDTWEIWNEAFFKQVPYYTKLVKASAEIIRKHQPNAHVWVSAPGTLENCYRLVDALKKAGAIDLVEGWIYHPYVLNPDADHYGHFDWGTVNQKKFRELIASLGPKHYVVQGETGCPAQLEFSHALNNHAWTEVAQAKWNLRSMMRGAADNVRLYSVFSMIDNQYTDFMLQSFGLLRADLAKEVVYRRPLYFACRNVFSFFDDTVKGEGIAPVRGEILDWADANERGKQREYRMAKFVKNGSRFVAVWQSDCIPGDSRGFDTVCLDLGDLAFKNPVWVDLITGRVCELDTLTRIPIWDGPVLLMDRALTGI